ncbi:WYL domain-containing protein [Aquirufa sp. HETE-83D]|uniref:WYL domain-containing protein n=1 Tax=Aquirufa esocilacus TaxID=3096513 RepID=A0ABW6DT69_9BACT
MNTTDRLKELNNLFLRKSFPMRASTVSAYFVDQFDQISYSERSFSRDLKALKEKLAERYPSLEESHGDLIRYSKSENRFYYIRDDISAFPSFSEKELDQIASMIDFNKHLFTGGNGNGIVNKLRAISLENNLIKHNDLASWPAIELINEGDRSGSEHVKFLVDAIAGKQLIEISHKGLTASSKNKSVTGLPLLIKEYNNGWYTGWYLLFQEIPEAESVTKISLDQLRLFALDRIDEIRESSRTAKTRIHPAFQPSDFFKNTLGLFRGVSDAERILLQIQEDSWIKEYVTKYPIHPSQNTLDSLHFELSVEINQELENFLLRYSTELQVIEPFHLREKIRKKLEIAVSFYQ